MAAGSAPDPDFDAIRRAWAAQSDRDEEAFRAALHPAIEAVPFGAQIADRSYRGPDRVMHWWRTELMANWEFYESIPEDFRRVGERILVTGRVHARGRQSGVELDTTAAWVMEVRDGQIAYWQTYTDAALAGARSKGVHDEQRSWVASSGSPPGASGSPWPAWALHPGAGRHRPS